MTRSDPSDDPQSPPAVTDDKDVAFLLETLQDFVFAMRRETDLIAKMQIIFILYGGFIFSAFPGIVALFYKYSNNNIMETMFPTSIGLFFASTALVTTLFLVTYALVKRRNQAKIDRNRLSRIVLMLVQRSSQLRDRGNIPFAQRVILDVRLADAEAELKRVDLNIND